MNQMCESGMVFWKLQAQHHGLNSLWIYLKAGLAYITKDDQLFIKKYNVYPERVYGEMSAANACFYYNKEELCEIEPIGPLETIKPGDEASFYRDMVSF